MGCSVKVGPDQIDSLLLRPGRSNFYGLAQKIKSRDQVLKVTY